mgnify:CR=1 FL=1|tara:strand:- start:2192 stop:3217 length:1026 start_codon:yes stop_codon:yes gene_type:complete
MEINILTGNSLDEYESFISKQPNTLLYHSKKYINFVSELLNCPKNIILAIDKDKEIVGAAPLIFKEGKYGKVYNSLPYFGSNGGIISNRKDATFALIKELNNLSKLPDTAAITIVENPLSDIKYTDFKSNLSDNRIGQFTMLPKDLSDQNDLLNLFHGKTRNVIRKANKSGLDFFIDNDELEFIRNTHNENMLSIGGLSKQDDFFKMIPRKFISDQDYKIYIAKYKNKPIAGLLLFYYNQTVEYFTPVIKNEFREKQALSGLIFKAMLDAIKFNFRIWNWGGTWFSQEGVFRFKNRWNANNIEYKYLTYLNNKYILNLSKEELLDQYKNFYVCPFSKLLSK